MIEPEEARKEPYLVETWHTEPVRTDLTVTEVKPQENRDGKSRTMGSPLPAGTARQTQELGYRTVAPQGRGLSGASSEDSGMQRAIGSIFRQAMPYVQKLLPLIDGNIATAVANLFASRPHAAPPSPPVDLTPVHNQLTELKTQHQDLREQVMEQNTSLKRVEDQLDLVREATDRNTLEQQELIEDLKAVGNKVNLFALLLFAMLIVSLILNVMLFLHIKQVFP
jgi:hypothetical protein